MLPALTDVIPSAEKNCSSTPQLGKDSVEHSGYFYIQAASECGFFFLCYFFKEKNHFVSKSKKECFKVAKPKIGVGGEMSRNSSATSLSCQQGVPLPCSLLWPDVFSVCECMCVWATLCLWFTAPPTLSPLSVCWSTAMLKEATIRSAINLDTSYLCLPLQGEVCAVTNMINPLPLCWQPPCTPPQPPSSPSLISGL